MTAAVAILCALGAGLCWANLRRELTDNEFLALLGVGLLLAAAAVGIGVVGLLS